MNIGVYGITVVLEGRRYVREGIGWGNELRGKRMIEKASGRRVRNGGDVKSTGGDLGGTGGRSPNI